MKTSLQALLCLIFSILAPAITLGQANNYLFDSLATDELPKNSPGTVIYISRGDQLLYKKAFGKANIELDVDMKTEDVFRLGSITKQFTACAILKLMEQGKLSLTDDIHKYIPDFPQKNEAISIEALLTHTSGVINYTGLPSFTEELKRKNLSPKQLVDLFKDEPLEYKPGTDYKYSNSGYILLGYIIEKVTGKPYGEYIEETIFKALGMNNSYYDSPTKLIDGRVSGYTQRNGHYQNSDYLNMTLPYAAGSLAANPADIQKWYSALYNGQFLQPESLKKAYSSYRLSNGRLTGYGYGWEIGNVQGSASVKHVGVVNGFFTYVAYLPEENLLISIFRNCDSPTDLDILASKMLAVALGKPYDYKPITMTDAKLETYQGVYKLENGGEYTIRLQDGNLMYYNLGGLRTRLIPYEKDHFVLDNSLTIFNFNKDSFGRINGFTIKGTGLPNKGNRKNIKVVAQKKIRIPFKLLQRYIGRYQFNPGPIFEVVTDNNKLFGQVGNDRKELVPFAEHEFFARDLDASIIFNVDAKGNVISLTKIQNTEMIAKKF
ncbi:serine hydrolase [Sphingobacterium sp. SRCM116780]|uniref:serine hydrolase n=1 Tax=Sphingobacterium sp. SRCM116780 TaxID=2907623 RepID=UPI001F305A03|nr:serine hydrolase [Sphingobacterium sp. SRCM116780]UIR56658.1 serine hydrolase [Sphingobacterium sp. SRCM116780]